MRIKALLLCAAVLFSNVALMTVGQMPAAHADPGCVSGGVYVLFARGSNETLGDTRARSFKDRVVDRLRGRSISVEWGELGNLDGTRRDGELPDESNEYPAVPVNDWHVLPPFYGNSVEIGMRELVTHLNHRYDPGYPGGRNCAQEKVVIGGYSQGADVVGWALRRHDLSAAAKSHIAYVALYGDPKFNPGSLQGRMAWSKPWWVRPDDTGFRYVNKDMWAHLSSLVSPIAPYLVNAAMPEVMSNFGALLPREPYVPDEFRGRFGSWCAYGDGICTGTVIDTGGHQGTHGSIYQNSWIEKSAVEIANVVTEQQGYFHGIPPDGAVVENYDGGGHKYVALGGALIYIPSSDDIWGYVAQMQRLYPSGQFHDILRMHNDEIHTLEVNWGGSGRWPANNSFFYDRGNSVQYIVQYGLAFSIANVDELAYLSGVDRAIMVPAGSSTGSRALQAGCQRRRTVRFC